MNKSTLLAMLLIASVVAIWEALCRVWAIPVFILPPPTRVFATAIVRADLLLPHAGVTALEIVSGIMVSLGVAVPLSMWMFASPSVEKAMAPLLVTSQAVPVFAVAPLLVVWLGYGMASKVLMAAVIIFFPITITLLEGFKSCDAEYRVLFDLMGATFWKKMRFLYWPWALPHFFAGLKVGVSVATIGAVIGEWVGAQMGLGYLMIQANARLKVDLVFAAILWLAFMGLTMWGLVGLVERRTVQWK
ncbi:Hydroxymethylpyrimidine ABC transporter, transmembrane component [Olavius algarvensis associated proteobacterium Delta 3]|nr:Hydroxymethylpyrimidine ABC transporter, transmembrane component [Olavius algarvensis associated proteobacterium Delta 3]CAB5164923.1 Hydroxymethylpyrimidine ABC transporter, transmembrane component [Olavius algarvensis associated proteobacterium Delta 3]